MMCMPTMVIVDNKKGHRLQKHEKNHRAAKHDKHVAPGGQVAQGPLNRHITQ
jgi:hypothetical protein